MNAQRRTWTHAEDQALASAVESSNSLNWKVIVQTAKLHFQGFNRNGKQCRERWLNHLNNNIQKSGMTPEQKLRFIRLHKQNFNKWCVIAKGLEGRSENFVKNFYYSLMRKSIRLVNLMLTHKPFSQAPLKFSFINTLSSMILQSHALRQAAFDLHYQIMNLGLQTQLDQKQMSARVCQKLIKFKLVLRSKDKAGKKEPMQQGSEVEPQIPIFYSIIQFVPVLIIGE